jgi:hypothetical protein
VSRSFNGSSDFAEKASAVISAAPLTMCCWFNSSVNALQTLMCISAPSTQDCFTIDLRGDLGGTPIRCSTNQNLVAFGSVNSTGPYSLNTWQHACAVFSSTSSRTIYLNGGNSASDATTVTPGGLTSTDVGCSNFSPQARFTTGMVAHAAVWSVALTPAQVTSLASGWMPAKIAPTSLVAYWPLYGLASPETDLSGAGNSLTLTGTARGSTDPACHAQMPDMPVVVPPLRAVSRAANW